MVLQQLGGLPPEPYGVGSAGATGNWKAWARYQIDIYASSSAQNDTLSDKVVVQILKDRETFAANNVFMVYIARPPTNLPAADIAANVYRKSLDVTCFSPVTF